MSRICPLFSGSKANCTYIASNDTAVLVDIGCSYKSFLTALNESGGDLSKIKAIFITHEHSDHIGGLKIFLKNNNIPVVASSKTLSTLIKNNFIPQDATVIDAESSLINVDGISVSRFQTSHDCSGSSGYSFTAESGEKVSVCTDTGILTEDAKNGILGSNVVLLESNHDITMLKNGPYNAALKTRILSDKGHLSNTACSEFLPELLKSGTTRIILGHLSQNNNTPLLAHSTAISSLSLIGAKENRDYILKIASPHSNGGIGF